jgi:hypothetical protein
MTAFITKWLQHRRSDRPGSSSVDVDVDGESATGAGAEEN